MAECSKECSYMVESGRLTPDAGLYGLWPYPRALPCVWALGCAHHALRALEDARGSACHVRIGQAVPMPAYIAVGAAGLGHQACDQQPGWAKMVFMAPNNTQRKRGRPPKAYSGVALTDRLGLRMNHDTMQRLRAKAKAAGCSLGDWLRLQIARL